VDFLNAREKANTAIRTPRIVFALEDVERLGGVVVDVERGTKSRRLVRFEEREDSARLVRVRFDRHREGAKVDRPPFARGEHIRLA
jgi:hypothetical protein